MSQSMRRGFTLVEILVVISLIGVFLLALAQLQASELRQSKAAATHDAGAARVDAAVKALRADMWVAESVWEGDEEDQMVVVTINIGNADIIESNPDGTPKWNLPKRRVVWKIAGNDRRLLQRLNETFHLEQGPPEQQGNSSNGVPWKEMVDASSIEEFSLPAPATIEAVHERFSFPNAWGGRGPIPYAIRLHIGDEQVFLPNQGIFTYGFHVMYPAEAKDPAQ